MRWQDRDGHILGDLYFIGNGVMARRQIYQRHWPGALTPRAMERRLAKLKAEGYIDWPTPKQRRTKPIPDGESLIWLGWKGILYIAKRLGVEIAPPRSINENQLRELEKRLRENHIRWLREPKFLTLDHDLKVIDCFIAFERSVAELPRLTIETWLPEGYFYTPISDQVDTVAYHYWDQNGNRKQDRKGVVPDFFVQITDQERKINGDPHRGRFLFEIDMANHTTKKFARERAAPGAAYIRTSKRYKKRFGFNSGSWLIFTTSNDRMNNLLQETAKTLGPDARYFFFTTFDRLNANLFSDAIWRRPGRREPWALLPPAQPHLN